ncbi:hypothetical protein EB796_013652 [Bugula neritina]|uniref:Uncharacterized protein n=1 Tax=Bugula neritina TaxID=10212 RepID=A0A7J7JPX3_BUGNE|nr:hypothetical protein EB796_013652 [Bugula neritina]
MIDSRWRNIATVVTSVILMLFVMVKVVLALALNLRSELWSDPTISDVPQVTRLITGVLILLDSIFVFPAAWTGICAAVSRHRGVYISLAVITSLAFLGAVGGIVAISWQFGFFGLFRDSGSINDELAIMLMVLQSLVVLILIMLLSFGVVAIIYESPDGPKHRNKMLLPNETRTLDNYLTSASYPTAPRAMSVTGASPYRHLTRGSPEWDRFYEQLYGEYKGRGRSAPSKYRHNSYRY